MASYQIGTRLLLAKLARGMVSGISLVPKSGTSWDERFFKITCTQVGHKFKNGKRGFRLVDELAVSITFYKSNWDWETQGSLLRVTRQTSSERSQDLNRILLTPVFPAGAQAGPEWGVTVGGLPGTSSGTEAATNPTCHSPSSSSKAPNLGQTASLLFVSPQFPHL